jgi:hypothetical protein
MPMRVPGVGEVMLPVGVLFAPVAPELVTGQWSAPATIRLRRRRDGLVDLEIRESR